MTTVSTLNFYPSNLFATRVTSSRLFSSTEPSSVLHHCEHYLHVGKFLQPPL